MYELEPFDKHFDARKHNKYLMRCANILVRWFEIPFLILWLTIRRADVISRKKQVDELEEIVRRLNVEKCKANRVQFTYLRCITESILIGESRLNKTYLFATLIGLMLSIVPTAIIIVNWIFHRAEQVVQSTWRDDTVAMKINTWSPSLISWPELFDPSIRKQWTLWRKLNYNFPI